MTFSIETKRIINSSQDIVSVAKRLEKLGNRVESIKSEGVVEGNVKALIDGSLSALVGGILEEAAKADSLGDALQMIANQYAETEKAITGMDIGIEDVQVSDTGGNTVSEESGTDKRGWFSKFWDWLTKTNPDDYDTTDDEQEKAADNAMKQELWEVLQDEKYSVENWDKASVEERKQILQDYMDEVIRIYGLQDVKTEIKWDSNATYTSGSVTWGYYTHRNHTVTLNEQVLTDSLGNWDSYDLLETVSHELRHAYQHEAIDHPTEYMVSKETINSWRENFDNYISSSTDYQGYRDQPVEVDARDFQVSREDASYAASGNSAW